MLDVMTIEKFRTLCLELREKFGQSAYSDADFNEAWKFWKYQPDEALEDLVRKAKAYQIRMPLMPEIKDPESFHADEWEDPHESIGARPKAPPSPHDASREALSRLLKRHNAKSIVELVGKVRLAD